MDKLKLEYVIKKQGYSVKDVSKRIGISRSAFYRKMNGTSEFTQTEIQKLIDTLKIESPMDIFFTPKVS